MKTQMGQEIFPRSFSVCNTWSESCVTTTPWIQTVFIQNYLSYPWTWGITFNPSLSHLFNLHSSLFDIHPSSIHPSIYLFSQTATHFSSSHLSIHSFNHIPIHSSIYPTILLPIYPSTHTFVHPFTNQPIRFSLILLLIHSFIGL